MNRVNSDRVTESHPCGCGYRDFNTDKHEPCCNYKHCKYSELARKHDQLISHIINAVTSDRLQGYDYEIAIENPLGTLRRRMDILSNDTWKRIAEMKTIDYCAYGHEFQKRTDIFTTLREWLPKGNTGSGLCEGRCGHGSKRLKYMHYHNMYNVTGRDSAKRKNAVPYQLLDEMIKCAATRHPEKGIVIDLCSGYQSMRAVAEDNNLVYVPVDMKDFRELI